MSVAERGHRRAAGTDRSGADGVPALLRAAAGRMDIDLTRGQVEQLQRFLRSLLLWRIRLSLVSQRTAADVIAKHVEDCLAVLPLVRPASRVVDLGSGAGFPGIVIAIGCPAAEVVLVESRRRKASFLRAVSRGELPGVGVLEARVEDVAREPGLAGSFDIAVSRAVWPPAEFLERARPLLAPRGRAVAMMAHSEAVAAPGYQRFEMRPYQLSRGERRVLLVGELAGCAPEPQTASTFACRPRPTRAWEGGLPGDDKS